MHNLKINTFVLRCLNIRKSQILKSGDLCDQVVSVGGGGVSANRSIKQYALWHNNPAYKINISHAIMLFIRQ